MNMKRVFSFVLAFVMVLSMVPTINAVELSGLTVNGLSVTQGETQFAQYGELTSAGGGSGSINCQLSGTQIVVVANPDANSQVGATLTFRNELDIPATLRFKYTFVHVDEEELEEDRAMVLGLSGDSGEFEKELAIGETYTITVISSYAGYDAATLTISNLALSTGGDVTATFQPAENGSYTVGGTEITADTPYTAAVGTKYVVSATAASGYRFFGWYTGSKYISYKAEDNLTINENCTICPVFIKDTVAVFGVGETHFQNLTEADTYAKEGAVKTIVLVNDGILTGEHTISAGNTLLIPYDDINSVHTEAISTATQKGELWENAAWEKPNAYRTLTMAQGAKLTVEGSLNVGGRHSSGPNLTAGTPSGDVGMIQMAEGTNITVRNGGVLYCWGYIYGDGTVTVNNGGAAHENFQFSDFRGGTATLGIAQTFIVFPISQYYVQNIEVATTFEHGAAEYVWGSIYMQSKVYKTSVKFIGDDPNLCMFVPGENGTVIKTYDPKNDRLIIDVNGDSSINPMALELGGTAINTATFALPINSNMTININSGLTALNQSLALLPGVELNIAKDATLSIASAEPLKNENGQYVHYTGSNNLIVYDRDQWLSAYQPIYNENGSIGGANKVDTYFVYTNAGLKRLQPVAYSPTRSYTRTEEDLVDAVVDINGKLITDGFIYTTVDVDLQAFLGSQQVVITGGGAAVISSEGTGVLVMNNGSGNDYITLQPIQDDTEITLAYLPMVSARLQNPNGNYLDSLGSAKGATFEICKECGNWRAQGSATHTVEITWIVDGVSGTQEVCKDTRPVYNSGTDPEKGGCEFIGWSTGADNEPEYTSTTLPVADADAAYYACFRMIGDLDLDGDVDSADLTLLARHVGKIAYLTDATALLNADVNGDGEIGAGDLTMHARYVGKIISSWN